MSEKTFERRVSVDADYKEQDEWEEYWFGDWVTRDEEEDAESNDKLRIPPECWIGPKTISSLARERRVRVVGTLIHAASD